MRINGLMSSLFGASGLAASGGAGPNAAGALAPVETTNGIAAETAAAGQDEEAVSALRDIVAHHDLRSISTNDFSQMVEELIDTGELDGKSQDALVALRDLLKGSGVDADQPLDLLAYVSERFAAQQDRLRRDEAAGGDATDALLKEVEKSRRQLEALLRLSADDANEEQPRQLDSVA